MQHMMRTLANEPVQADEPGQTGQTADIDRGGGGSPLAVDLEETENAYIVEVDLPGVTPVDLVVEWGERHLLLHGEVKGRAHTGELHRQTRATGSFDHTVALPGPIDGTGITATLAHGVLTVHAPKTSTNAADTSRRVAVNTTSPHITASRPTHAGTTTPQTG
jgi:HSP20 family protein